MTTRPSYADPAGPGDIGTLDPGTLGLPDERELASLAAGYFPEFNVKREAEPAAYHPVVVPFGAPDTVSAAFARDVNGRAYVGNVPLENIRADFPILSEKINGHPLIWLDNAATTQRPRQVIERLARYYEHENSNVHRGAHTLAARSTDAFEGARAGIADFIGAPGADEIIFVRGSTEGLNLVAYAFVKPLLRPGDEIILTFLEHHANIVPWQIIAEETGAVIRAAPVDDSGQIIIAEYASLFGPRTRFVSAAHVSNAIGTIAPVEEMIAIAHGHGVRVCVDGAQSVSHMPVDVKALDADFFVFSGHKIFGPNGIGAVYGKSELLEAARPWQGGGNMIADVTFERTQYQRAPRKFEAGTGSIADAVALGAAIDYVSAIGMENIYGYEAGLFEYALSELSRVPGLTFVGSAARRAGVISFVLDGYANEDVGRRLNEKGIAVRAGHHCAQPVLRRLGYEGTVRPSIAFYNTSEEIDTLARALYGLTRRI
ncbi:MAG: cysteine desulfurase [Synergistaceae bacterium]|jgi:cysteine desulfurase/selenocysteine lyase|nr:cysteine desulfurase [Synergistaceae bacterium]